MIKAILMTLAYADIFDYPLKASEIRRYLISDKKIDFKNFQKELSQSSKLADKQGDYFFLKGRKKIVAIRKQRENQGQKKLIIARRTTNWLKMIPTIKMIGVTGALAMNNAREDDDIDILIVTSKNRLWLTRFLVVLLTELVARRRHPNDKETRDKICLNMFLDEKCLGVPEKERDLFTAHEVCQLVPIYDRNGTYKKFLEKNLWVKKYLPNWKP